MHIIKQFVFHDELIFDLIDHLYQQKLFHYILMFIRIILKYSTNMHLRDIIDAIFLCNE